MSNNRWNHIKKKYNLNNNITSSTVQKFLEMNFTDCVKDELCGVSERKILDPALIMEIRHEAVRQQARKPWKEESTFKQKEIFMENIKSHNNLVDSRLIDSELAKFKMEVRKMNSYSNRRTLLTSVANESDHEEHVESSKAETPLLDSSDIKQFIRESDGSSSASMSEDSLESMELIKVSALPKSHDFDQGYFDVDVHQCEGQQDENAIFYECCNEQCEFSDKNHDTRSFYSLPNLTIDDVDDLMIISKYQSVMSIDQLYPDCPCCPQEEQKQEIVTEIEEIKHLDEKIEDAETEKMLIVKRMELEEKNYQQLMVLSHADQKSEDNLYECERIVTNLFQESEDLSKNKRVLRVYFKEWLQKVTVSKILKTNSFSNKDDRVKKINGFLNKIRLEQNKAPKIVQETPKKSSPPLVKSLNSAYQKDYEHKLKMQQDIIEMQKLKIKRQEQLITEIKLAKFSEMVKQSKKDLKLELINSKRVNAKLRAKARSIRLVANIPTDPLEEERRLLLAQGLVVPKFLARMQERAQERHLRHEEASQRRLRIQQEKEEAKNASELAKQLEDEEAKKKRLLELREKRRQEKLAKQLKEQERERYLMNLKRARDHYGHYLMKRLGFRAFELLIKLKRMNYKISTTHRRFACMKKYFFTWRKISKSVWDDKRAHAEKNYEFALLRRSVKIWIHIHSINQSKYLVAIDWYEMKVCEKIFNRWVMFTEQCKMVESKKMSTAIAHYNCQIKWKLLECWQRFPALMKIEREADVRRQKWRLKILDLIPDYKPQEEL